METLEGCYMLELKGINISEDAWVTITEGRECP